MDQKSYLNCLQSVKKPSEIDSKIISDVLSITNHSTEKVAVKIVEEFKEKMRREQNVKIQKKGKFSVKKFMKLIKIY